MSLKDKLIARIEHSGPITVGDYITDCLLHPEYGYYTTRDPLGRQGDFITAPEISQMYGELIGLSLAQAWIDQGQPGQFTLAEPGPGRGTLMADLLRATRAVPGFHDAMDLCLIEASPTLRDAQALTLADYAPRWLETVSDLPEQPLFLVANEFIDALPVRQFVRRDNGWAERLVGLQDGNLHFGLGSVSAQASLAHRLNDTKDGDLVEVCAAAITNVDVIATRIANYGGGALIIDYGDWRSLGDTLQALHDHAPVDPLDAPGTADLTTHVDFEPLCQTARAAGCAHSKVTPQGMFLERLGITQRAQALAQPLGGDALNDLIQAHRRLTHPEEMGNLFKVLGLYPANGTPPPGLDP